MFDLVESLRREVNPPGTDLFPDATDDDWGGKLTDAFWEIRLFGLLSGFEENAAARGGPTGFGEGKVTPTGVDETYDDPIGYAPLIDLGRERQQLIVLWAGYKVVINRLASLNTVFRAKAGPVEYETQNAASLLKAVLDQLKARMDYVLNILRDNGTTTAVFDAIVERNYSQAVGEVWWVR